MLGPFNPFKYLCPKSPEPSPAVPLVSANPNDELEHVRVYNAWMNGGQPTPRAEHRAILRSAFHQDTTQERKRLWLAAQHPRLKKGDSGIWWCVSEHKKPTHVTMRGTQIFVRVGNGTTPLEAYKSWMEF